jgi:beta-glucosidase
LLAVLSPILERGATPKSFPSEPDHALGEVLLVAHRKARDVLASLPTVRSGYTVACFNFHPVDTVVPEWTPLAMDWYLEQAADDDFLGVQCYSRVLLGPEGPLEPDPSAERTSIGTEYYPDCVAETVARAWGLSGHTPLLVTENGIPTNDDEQRERYLREAVAGLGRAMAEGIDVGGYFHWSLIDNFEWVWGFGPKYGLAAVNRETFARTLKPSARVFADIARRGRI